MSGRDEDREGFLGRWIKRKAEVRERGGIEPDAPPAEEANAKAQSEDERTPEEPAFDLSSLPRLEDITPDTKLADFMRKEVPAALRNAALKRAWALDPAIRDYVNPAREYAYDWNVPGGVPGNGPLDASFDAMKEVARAISAPPQDHTLGLGDATPPEAREPNTADSTEPEPPSPVRVSEVKNTAELPEKAEESDHSGGDAQGPRAAEKGAGAPRRRHGGAAPV